MCGHVEPSDIRVLECGSINPRGRVSTATSSDGLVINFFVRNLLMIRILSSCFCLMIIKSASNYLKQSINYEMRVHCTLRPSHVSGCGFGRYSGSLTNITQHINMLLMGKMKSSTTKQHFYFL